MPLGSLAADEKKLNVYTSQKTYSVQVTDADGTEYLSVFELLEPLGKLQLKVNGKTFKLQFDQVEGEFSEGKKLVRIGKNQILLPQKAITDHGRLLIPLRAAPGVIEKYLGQRPELHEAGRRLFVGTSGDSLGFEIKRPENNLVLSFASPVNPTVTAEGGRVHLTFAREPVTFGADSITYNDKLITTINLTERNGSAEVTVTGTAPLAATLADGGRTISISAAPATAAATPPPSASTPLASTTNQPVPAAPESLPPGAAGKSLTQLPAGAVRFFVMIDPSHGGDDAGVRFSDKLLEKDITLAIARKLRAELQNRGIAAVLTRDNDATLSYDQRAVASNGQRAGLYIAIHAGTPGAGVRVYTSMSSTASQQRAKPGPFLLWDAAQVNYLQRSRALADALAKEFVDAKLRSGTSSAPLLPLRSIAAPAVAVEVAPSSPGVNPESMTVAKYQQTIASAIAAGIAASRGRLEERQ